MSLSVPKLKIFYIKFENTTRDTKEVVEVKEPISVFSKITKNIALHNIADAVGKLLVPRMSLAEELGIVVATTIQKLMENKCVDIIKNNEELSKYINAGGNTWVTNGKQSYVCHPKISKNNVLIEAQNFYDTIEEEEKSELINFIFSHCPAKSVKIDREENTEIKAKGKAKVELANAEAGINYSKAYGNYYSWNSPVGPKQTEPKDEYLWLDNSIMDSICQLSEGASFSQVYERDFTFGFTAKEAKSVGLDVSKCKKYYYKMQIEC